MSPIAVLRRAARYHEIRDDDLNGLVVLVERGRSHLDQPLIWTRPRWPHLEDLALGPQLISRPVFNSLASVIRGTGNMAVPAG
jgi:hypothetical protein